MSVGSIGGVTYLFRMLQTCVSRAIVLFTGTFDIMIFDLLEYCSRSSLISLQGYYTFQRTLLAQTVIYSLL